MLVLKKPVGLGTSEEYEPLPPRVTVPSILAKTEARLRQVLEYLDEKELPKVVEDEHRVEADIQFLSIKFYKYY